MKTFHDNLPRTSSHIIERRNAESNELKGQNRMSIVEREMCKRLDTVEVRLDHVRLKVRKLITVRKDDDDDVVSKMALAFQLTVGKTEKKMEEETEP